MSIVIMEVSSTLETSRQGICTDIWKVEHVEHDASTSVGFDNETSDVLLDISVHGVISSG